MLEFSQLVRRLDTTSTLSQFQSIFPRGEQRKDHHHKELSRTTHLPPSHPRFLPVSAFLSFFSQSLFIIIIIFIFTPSLNGCQTTLMKDKLNKGSNRSFLIFNFLWNQNHARSSILYKIGTYQFNRYGNILKYRGGGRD